MLPNIIICGKMASGKTTIKDIIMTLYPEYKHMAFGQKVKDVAKDLFNMNVKNRELLVKIGTAMRDIDANVWVNYIKRDIQNNPSIPVIIDDLRYQNEYDIITEGTGTWFKINIDISSKLQLKRLKETYPNNWEIHRKYINHHSEGKKLKNIKYNLEINMDYYDKQNMELSKFKEYYKTIFLSELYKDANLENLKSEDF